MIKTISINTLADNLKQLIDDYAEKDLFEALLQLNDEEIGNPAEEFYTIYKVLQNITCALTNPEFSSMLDKGYQSDVGRVLKNLLSFFEHLYESNEIHKLVLHKWLINFPGGADVESLSNTVEWFTAKEKKVKRYS